MIDRGFHFVYALLELRDTLQLTVGMVIFERTVGYIVLELAFINQLTVLVFLPHSLFLAVFVLHIDTILRKNDKREQQTKRDNNNFFHSTGLLPLRGI